MKRRFPWWLLFVAFIAVPLIEIYVIIQVGQVIGAWWTILLLIADSIFGSWLIKREGGRAWLALRAALEAGRLPHRELADGVLILVGGHADAHARASSPTSSGCSASSRSPARWAVGCWRA